MSVGTPDNATQVEDRIKTDVQREAPDSNPFLTVHWLRSLIAGIARRIFDFYQDLARVETRLFPDTADDETSLIWGDIYVGTPNVASAAVGELVAAGVVGGVIPIGETLAAGGQSYTTTSSAVIAAQVLNINSITRSGTTATATTASDHGLSSFIPVTIAGADQTEYNVTDAAITITGLDTFEYQVSGSPASPASGTISSSFTTANVLIKSEGFGEDTNLARDTTVTLQQPLVDVNDTLFVTFGAIGGGTDDESTADYKDRYLDKIRNPVANFNSSDIIAEAKKVAGVTRVFVEEAGQEIGTISITTLTREGSVAKAVTSAPHGFEDGSRTSVNGADQTEYNVSDTPILVEDATTFYYIVAGAPVTPATGTINAATTLALGQVRTFFMRDNDVNPIPSGSEVQTVKDQIDTIRPAPTSVANNIVRAPVPVTVNFIFTSLTPDTSTMRPAVVANLGQFFEEQTTVGVDVDEDAYRAAISNTVDTDTGDKVQTFTLSTPSGDITINSGELAILGTVQFV